MDGHSQCFNAIYRCWQAESGPCEHAAASLVNLRAATLRCSKVLRGYNINKYILL